MKLTITFIHAGGIDNGSGVGVTDGTQIPVALARRAKLLGADFEMDTQKTEEPVFILRYQPRRAWWRRIPALNTRN